MHLDTAKRWFDGINTIDKCYIYQLLYNVQQTEFKKTDSQILIHSFTESNDFSLAKTFLRHISKEHRKNGVIIQVNYRKRTSKRKWTDREYHVQN